MRWNVPGKARSPLPPSRPTCAPRPLRTGSTPSWPPLPSWAKPPARHRGRSPPHLLSFPPQKARPPWTPCRTMHRMQAPLLTPQALPPLPPPPPVRPWTSRAPSSPRRPPSPRPPTTRPPPGAASASAARSSPTPTCCRAAKARSCTTWPAATSPPTSSQQLYISEGTAKTHIRHIYRKLNIHSQQDLIHLIDEVEL